jgi:uncharacterized RDD family membrane protein YckC
MIVLARAAGSLKLWRGETEELLRNMPAELDQPDAAPSSPPAPWWARALSGAIVGALAGLVLAAIIAVIALVLTVFLPGVGAPRIWKSAATVMAFAMIAGIIRSAWYGIRRGGGERAR